MNREERLQFGLSLVKGTSFFVSPIVKELLRERMSERMVKQTISDMQGKCMSLGEEVISIEAISRVICEG